MTSKAVREERERLQALGVKECSKCKAVKPLDEFGREAAGWDGRSPRCRACIAIKDAKTAADRRARWSAVDADPYEDPTYKRCYCCGEPRSRRDFLRNPRSRDGLRAECRTCRATMESLKQDRRRAKWANADPYDDPAPKRCADCRQDRPRSDFGARSSMADGLWAYCRGCAAAREAARRAMKRGQWVEHVDRDKAWRMANGVCYLCGLAMDPNRWHLDHVNPIDNGGEHSYFNTAPTHPECNLAKGAKTWPKLHSWDHAAQDWVLAA